MDYYDLTTQIHDLEYKFGQIVHAQLYEAEEKLKDLRPVLRHPHDVAQTFPDLAIILVERYNIRPEPPHAKKTTHTNLKHFEALEDLISALDYLTTTINKQKFPTVKDHEANIEYLFYVNRLIGAVQSSPPEITEHHQSIAGQASHQKRYGEKIDFVRSIVNIEEWEKNQSACERKVISKFRGKFNDPADDIRDSDTIKKWITDIAKQRQQEQRDQEHAADIDTWMENYHISK